MLEGTQRHPEGETSLFPHGDNRILDGSIYFQYTDNRIRSTPLYSI